MKRARVCGWMALAALVAGAVGCNAVPRKDYDALQAQYNEMTQINDELQSQLELAKADQADLKNRVLAHMQRTTSAQQEAARLREDLRRKPKQPPPPPAGRNGPQYKLVGGLFGPGKATLTKDGLKQVTKVAAAIKDQYQGATVVVYGHTDADPIGKSPWKDNLELSGQRAMAVTRQLIKIGIPAKNIETVAMGAAHPVADNATIVGKAKNRRVVVKILR